MIQTLRKIRSQARGGICRGQLESAPGGASGGR